MPPPQEAGQTGKPFDLGIAERVHGVTGKEHLARICIGGFVLESAWHAVVERRFLGTPQPAVRKALLWAAVFWPVVGVATAGALRWAAWRVAREETRRGTGLGSGET